MFLKIQFSSRATFSSLRIFGIKQRKIKNRDFFEKKHNLSRDDDNQTRHLLTELNINGSNWIHNWYNNLNNYLYFELISELDGYTLIISTLNWTSVITVITYKSDFLI